MNQEIVIDYYTFNHSRGWPEGSLFNSNWLIGLVSRVFANGPGDLGPIPGRVIPKTLKMVLDTSLLNTQQYKVCIKGKVEQSKERSMPTPTPRCSSYWKDVFWSPTLLTYCAFRSPYFRKPYVFVYVLQEKTTFE